eukprot:TRINITY_DN3470_c0_g1_i1.p1 TRINITY_DN3470_c0_g1~~TRINITY_DN3470_c0_g1_i1.p1  ORF type:complete len:158 (-),score=39.25 TRINITY_DN3470_c0_g1_i1:239-712(-)
MALSPEEAKLIKDSWALVKPDLEKHSVVLFEEIFILAPGIKPLFKFVDSDSPAAQKKWKMHTRGVLRMAGNAAVGLGDEAETERWHDVLYDLGARHAKYSALPAHFPVVGQALLNTLEKGFGPAWTPELKAAWAHAYTLLTKPLTEGLEEGIALAAM